MRAALYLIAAIALYGQAARDPHALLAHAQDKLRSMMKRLPNYVCTQTIDRRYFSPADAPNPPLSCSQIDAAKASRGYKLELQSTDRLRLDVAVSEGHEIQLLTGGSQSDLHRADQIIGGGPIESGSFGIFLLDVFDNPGVQFQYVDEKATNGRERLNYTFRVPIEASHYRMKAGEKWQITAYSGSFAIDPGSLDIERLTIRTDELPKETAVCEAATVLDYERIRIGENDFLLPRESQFQVIRRDANETNNITTFSACRQYLAESTVRFDELEATKPETRRATAQAVLPAGLALSLALMEAIDTDTAAAGDTVLAKTTKPVRVSAHSMVIPAGAVVRGRITLMEHRLNPAPHFILTLSFDSIEANGVVWPLAARLDTEEVSANRSAIGGSFLFATEKSRYVIPRGYSSKWLTVARAANP